MSMSDKQISRWEKSSSLIRNIILILAALIPAAIYVGTKYKQPVEARLVTFESSVSKFAFVDREIMKQCVNETNKSSKLKLNEILTNLGRLDGIISLTVSNLSTANIDLSVKFRNKSDPPVNTQEKRWDPLPKNQFILVDAFTSCAIEEQDLQVGNKGRLALDDTGSIHIKGFPPECRLFIEIANARSYYTPIEIYADGKKINITKTNDIGGKLGDFAKTIERMGAIGYGVFIILPVAFLMLIAIAFVRLLGRKEPQKECDPKA